MTALNNPLTDVSKLNVDELVTVFKTLEAPDLAEMNGEYTATLLKQRSLFATVAGLMTVSNPIAPGKWLCKAFRPVNDTSGRGYNTFQHFGRVVQRFPMRTLIAPSRYDQRPAYQLVYRAYQSFCGDVHMVDEVRRLVPGSYLGIGTWGFSDAQRRIPFPFLLTGPVAPYRADIGIERDSFALGKEVPGIAQAAQQGARVP